MIIGVLNVDLFIPDSASLKTKRFAIKSIKDRLRNHFNVSVAEIDHNDKWQRAALGIVIVSNETKYVESILGNALNLINRDHRVQVVQSTITYV